MLNFVETDNRYIIEEKIMTFDEDITTTVKYTKDLRFKKVDKDPWRKTTDGDLKWFDKYYKRMFNYTK